MELMQMRRRLMQYDELPPIYRRVAWLEGKGAQYIDTGINARSGLRAKYSVIPTSTDSANYICAAIGAGRIYFPYISNSVFEIGYGGSITAIPDITVGVDIRYDIDAFLAKGKISISVDGVVRYTKKTTSSYDLSKSLFLFASNNKYVVNQGRAYAKILYFSLEDHATSELLANYIPCVRKSDSKPGMYDTVSRTFKTNAGSGEFGVPV